MTGRTDWWNFRVMVGMPGEGGGHLLVGTEGLHHTMPWLCSVGCDRLDTYSPPFTKSLYLLVTPLFDLPDLRKAVDPRWGCLIGCMREGR